MKAGNLKFFFILIIFLFFSLNIYSQEKLELENIQPTFEEENEIKNEASYNDELKLKSKSIKKNKSGNIIVKLKALDKITAKTSNLNIPLGKKKKFGYLEIYPRKCAFSNTENEKGVVAYIQVKDLSNKKDDKVFVFNGWTFSSSITLRTFDHPVYDLWVTGCENI